MTRFHVTLITSPARRDPGSPRRPARCSRGPPLAAEADGHPRGRASRRRATSCRCPATPSGRLGARVPRLREPSPAVRQEHALLHRRRSRVLRRFRQLAANGDVAPLRLFPAGNARPDPPAPRRGAIRKVSQLMKTIAQHFFAPRQRRRARALACPRAPTRQRSSSAPATRCPRSGRTSCSSWTPRAA